MTLATRPSKGDGPRVLMTTDAVGGVWSFVMALAAGLASQGCSPVLLTLGPAPSARQREQAANVPGLELLVTDLTLDWMDKEGRDKARAMRALKAVENATAPDIVHVNGHREANADWRAPVVLTSHSCVATWWRACRGHPPPLEWESYCADVATALRRVDIWVTPSQALATAMEEAHQPLRSAEVIWNGLSAQPAAVSRHRHLILGAGRLWDEAKGIQTLVEAAEGLSWPVALAGAAGPDEEETPRDTSVQRLGHVPSEEMAVLMGEAEVFAAPAVYEPFGLAVLEAARAGCALVLSDIPTFRELWSGTAAFFPPGDVSAMHRQLERLIHRPDLRAQLQRRARTRAAIYGGEQMSRNYMRRYQSLWAGRQPAAIGGAA